MCSAVAGVGVVAELREKQFADHEMGLAEGATAHGSANQRWTLARIKMVIGRRFQLTYTLQGVRKWLVRNGCYLHRRGVQTCKLFSGDAVLAKP